jgi:hypothetical protein
MSENKTVTMISGIFRSSLCVAALSGSILSGGAVPYTIAKNDPGWTSVSTEATPFLYKGQAKGVNPTLNEEGTAEGIATFSTSFYIDPSDPKEYALIDWDESLVTPSLTSLYIKSGPKAWTIDLSGVDFSSHDSLMVYNPYVTPAPIKGISHVTVYGSVAAVPDEPISVPDGGSMALMLGCGALAIVTSRRLAKA